MTHWTDSPWEKARVFTLNGDLKRATFFTEAQHSEHIRYPTSNYDLAIAITEFHVEIKRVTFGNLFLRFLGNIDNNVLINNLPIEFALTNAAGVPEQVVHFDFSGRRPPDGANFDYSADIRLPDSYFDRFHGVVVSGPAECHFSGA